MRICRCCKVEKPKTDFRYRKNRPGGVGYPCKDCEAENSRKYRKENPEKIREYNAKWTAENPDYRNLLSKEKYDNDPEFRMRCVLRSRLTMALKRDGLEKDASAIDLLGCPVWHLWAHFDFLFRPGMTRDNHGKVWEVDHIRPVVSFDLTDPEQQKRCFHWTNLQPLFVKENREKSAKYGS